MSSAARVELCDRVCVFIESCPTVSNATDSRFCLGIPGNEFYSNLADSEGPRVLSAIARAHKAKAFS